MTPVSMVDQLIDTVRSADSQLRGLIRDYDMVRERLRRYEPTALLPRHRYRPLAGPAVLEPPTCGRPPSTPDADGVTSPTATEILALIRQRPGISCRDLAALRSVTPQAISQCIARHIAHLVRMRHLGEHRVRCYYPL